MGIKEVFGKTLSKISSFVGIKTNGKQSSHASFRLSMCAASIGSVFNKIFGEEEVGDKVEITKKDDTKKDEVKDNATNPITTNKSQKPEVKKESKPVKKETKKVSEEELNKVRVELRNKCIEAGINYGQLIINMAAITGKTIIEFSKLDKNLQIAMFTYVMQSIDNVNKANLPGVKKLDAVVTDAALMYHFVTHDKTGKPIDIENITPEELKERREVFNEKLKKRREEKLAEIEKLPESERAAAKEALKEEMAGYRKHVFDELKSKIPFESALELILIVSVKNLGDAAKELMESYPVEIREKIANTLHDFDSFKEYLKTVKGDVNELTQEEKNAIEQYHRIFGTYKTKENLEAYENQFQEARKNGELTEEVSRATAKGIGEAAYANINMTSEEKETFIQNWVVNNDGLLTDADMAQVEETATKYIQELIENNPKIKDNFQHVQKNIKEIVEKTLNRIFDAKKSTTKENRTKEANEEIKKFIQSPFGKVHSINKEVLSNAQLYIRQQAEKFETPAIKKSTEQIEYALLKGIIDEKQALKNLDNSEHKFVKMCVKNAKLASKYEERIILYIQTEKDEEKLKELAAVAPHDIVIKIVRNMRGNRQRLAEELIVNHEIDRNTQVLLKKCTEEQAA